MSLFSRVKSRAEARIVSAGRNVKADLQRRAKEYAEERTFRRGVEKEAREITKTTGREAYRKRRLERARVEAVRRASQPVLPTGVRGAKAAQRVSKSAYNVGKSMMAIHDQYFGLGGGRTGSPSDAMFSGFGQLKPMKMTQKHKKRGRR